MAALVNGAAPLSAHIEDDVALYWLANPATAPAAARALATPTASVDPRAAPIFTSADPRFVAMFGDPTRDPRTPDVIVQVEKGTIDIDGGAWLESVWQEGTETLPDLGL